VASRTRTCRESTICPLLTSWHGFLPVHCTDPSRVTRVEGRAGGPPCGGATLAQPRLAAPATHSVKPTGGRSHAPIGPLEPEARCAPARGPNARLRVR
jgi:hypothetical protein